MKNTPLGFTLVELIVVITIIGILSVSGLTFFTNAKIKARDSIRLLDIRKLTSITEQINIDRLGGDSYLMDEETIVNGEDCTYGYPYSSAYAYLSEKVEKLQYIEEMPKDPINTEDFVYRYTSNEHCTAYEYSIQFEHKVNFKKMNEDKGDDPLRFEFGTYKCLNKENFENCDLGAGIDTQLEETNIEYKKDLLDQRTTYLVSIF